MIRFLKTTCLMLATLMVSAQKDGPTLIKDMKGENLTSQPTIQFIGNDQMYLTALNDQNRLELMVINLKDSSLTHLGVGYAEQIKANQIRFFRFQDSTYFIANYASTRHDLWTTDGTAKGTRKIMEMTMNIDDYAVTDDYIYLGMYVDTVGKELFATDGSAAGTFLVKDIYPGKSESRPADFVVDGNRIFFTANDSAHGEEVWVSDGTTSGTHLVADVMTGTNSSLPSGLFAYRGDVYFKAKNPDDNYYYIWKTEGADTSVSIFRDQDSAYFSQFGDPVVCDSILYFSGNRSTYGRELYRSDGTRKGTYLVKDLDPGYNTTAPMSLTCIAPGMVLFTHDVDKGRELYVSDGTSAGTRLTRDLYPIQTDGLINNMTGSDSILFFSAHEDGKYHDFELYVFRNGKNYRIKDIYEGSTSSNLQNFMAYNGGVFFTADDGKIGREIWYSDGTTSGTKVFYDVASKTPDNVIESIARTPNGVIFNASNDSLTDEAWTFDLTSKKVTNLIDYKNSTPGKPRNFMSTPNGVYYSILPGSFDMEINYYDFNTGKISEVLDNGYKNVVDNFRYVNKKFFYTLHVSLYDNIWMFDENTQKNKVLTNSIQPNGFGASAKYLTVVGDRIFFTADNYTEGIELYVTDGTTGGTDLVKDIYPDYHDSRPLDLCSFRDSLLVFSASPSGARQLYITDGTSSNTKIIRNTSNGGPGTPKSMTEAFGKIFFTGSTASSGEELWVTDGTENGTMMLKDLVSGSASSNPANYHYHKELGLLFFTTQTATKEYSLWRTDGSDNGTYKIQTFIDSTYTTAYTPEITHSSDKLFLSVRTDSTGIELWESDGTEAGTKLVKDINPGKESSAPQHLTMSNGHLFFTATDPQHGRELWYMQAVCLQANVQMRTQVCQGDSLTPAVSLVRKNENSTVDYSWYVNGKLESNASSFGIVADSLEPYTIVLEVSDSDGCSSRTEVTAEVISYPTASFTVDNDTQCFTGHQFKMSNQSTAKGASSLNYLWLRGDGGQTTTFNPYFTYSSAGKYKVELIATNYNLCSDTFALECYAVAAPKTASISGPNNSDNDSETYTANVSAQNKNTLTWSVTNGTITSGQGTKSIDVKWNSRPTVAVVSLKETSPEGCEGNTVNRTVTVNKPASVANVREASILVWPNPTSGRIQIKNEGSYDITNLTVTDYLGKTVYVADMKGRSDSFELNLPDGIYVVYLNGPQTSLSERVIVRN